MTILICQEHSVFKTLDRRVSVCFALTVLALIGLLWCFNSSPAGQNGCHFADDSFKCIFMNEKFCISFQISLKFVPKCQINNLLALV